MPENSQTPHTQAGVQTINLKTLPIAGSQLDPDCDIATVCKVQGHLQIVCILFYVINGYKIVTALRGHNYNLSVVDRNGCSKRDFSRGVVSVY